MGSQDPTSCHPWGSHFQTHTVCFFTCKTCTLMLHYALTLEGMCRAIATSFQLLGVRMLSCSSAGGGNDDDIGAHSCI